LNSSRLLYDELLQKECLDCEWETRGLLFVLQSRAGMDHFAETNQLLGDSFGLSALRYDSDALVDLEPALKPGLAGGWLYPADAHLRPDKLLASWRRLLEARGVEVRERCEVKGFARQTGRARALLTEQGEMPAEVFVIATGAWTPFLEKALGCR